MSNPGQQDPQSAYGQLNQGQLGRVAREFMQRFKGTNDPQAQRFTQTDPNQATPQQVAQMHDYAAQHHPGILGDVMKHPVITGLLGGFATYELDKHVRGRA